MTENTLTLLYVTRREEGRMTWEDGEETTIKIMRNGSSFYHDDQQTIKGKALEV